MKGCIEMIRIVNLRNYVANNNEVLIKIDRSSVLGNPYYMKDESMRDLVCDKYQSYMDSIVCNYLNSANELVPREQNYVMELNRIIQLVRQGKNIALGCWCYPKRCHGESIKKLVEQYK